MPNHKRIVLNTFGSFGDIHPYIALAIELQARGHEPVIATSPLYREKIEGAGLSFAPIRPDMAPPKEQAQELIEKIMEPKTGPRFLLEELIFPFLRESYEDLLETVSGADALVTHPAAPAGPLVGRKTGKPWISTVLAPFSFFSAYDPPVPPFWSWTNKLRILGPGVIKVFLDAMKRSYRPEAFDALREELGLADFGNPLSEAQHSPTLVLALFSSLFASSQPDWPAHSHVTGFAFYDGRHEGVVPRELVDFLDNGSPPLVFTLGSSAVWVARDFFTESIVAARSLGKRAVLLVGDERNMPDILPDDIIAIDYAPYQWLLPLACAVVHHGGVGTTSQGLLAGVPTLIVPFAFDQVDNADHARRLGTSRTLYQRKYAAGRVTKELGILLGQSAYAQKAKAVSDRLKQENGAATASDFIEQLLTGVGDMSEELVYASGN
jgi:rhamnosyltransferase subunit B